MPSPSQNFSDSIELFEACNAVFSRGGEAAAEPLTPRQEQQALVAFLRGILGQFQMVARRRDLPQRTFDALIAAVSAGGSSRRCCRGRAGGARKQVHGMGTTCCPRLAG